MNAPASFLSLPPELVADICRSSGLEKKDLIALHLTNKSQGIHVWATREYGERKFTNLRILFTRYSLQSFVNICEHPEFGRCVRRVQLSNAHAGLRGMRFLVDGERFNLKSEDSLLIEAALLELRSLMDRYYEEIRLEESKEGQSLLDSAFAFLAQHGNPLSLAVDNDKSNSIGHQTSFIDENCYSGWLWMPHTKIRASLLISSAARQSCEISEIEIKPQDYDRFCSHRDDGDSICFSGIDRELHAIGPTLKRLYFTLTAHANVQSVESLKLILTEATHLEDFRLVCNSHALDPSSLSEILRAVTPRSLVTIVVSCGHDLPKPLIGMLAKSKLSIKRLVWSGARGKMPTISNRNELSDWVEHNLTALQDSEFCDNGCCISPAVS